MLSLLNARLLLLATYCFPTLVLGVIHNLAEDDLELVQPLAVDISPDVDGDLVSNLGRIAKDILGPDFFAYREKRQTDDDTRTRGSGEPPTDIGTTARLDGTNRHYFALVHWTGHPSEVLFIVTMTRRNNPTDSCLWRSTDYGKTFSNDTHKLNDTNVVIKWYHVSPLESNLVMVDSRQRKIFVTRDEGETYVGYSLDFTPDDIDFQSRGIPNVLEGSLPEHMLGYEQERQALYVTPDLGETWVPLGNNISRYYWRRLSDEYEANTALYYEKDINKTHAMLMVTEDPYDEHREFDPALGAIAINTTVFSYQYLFVQQPVNWTNQEVYTSPLWVSVYRQPFRKAIFGFELRQEHFAVMDASENQVFLAVEHSDGSHVHLYLSDADGVNYAFSLEDVVTTADWGSGKPSFDIHAVKSVEGTYVVNRYNRAPPPMEPNATVPEPTVSTLISYNKGGHWQYLVAPAVDANNIATLCHLPQCSLHLRMDTDKTVGYTSIQSKNSAIGMILAQGNTGESLVEDDGRLRVYLSHDGGFSWQEVRQGHWMFQMVALGSILVLVPKRPTVDPVDYILWSCDEGTTWTSYVFTETPMRLIGLLPEKGEKARRLTLFGYFRNVRPFAWLIVELDFSDSVPTQCNYPDDYFEWIPSDGRSGQRCVQGVEKTFERRNSSICCYVNPKFERPINNVSCMCSREDYECDVGFEQVEWFGPCEPSGGPTSPPEDCTEGGDYYKKSGYRMITGHECTKQPDSPFLSRDVPCPPVAPGGLNIHTKDIGPGGISVDQEVTLVLTQATGWVVETEYEWDFGDGFAIPGKGLSNISVQCHLYSSAGNYSVSVTASNDAGTSVISIVLLIGVAPGGLSIAVEGDLTKAGEDLIFTLSQKVGLIIDTLYEWDFGDDNSVSGYGLHDYAIRTHSYDKEGSYKVKVTASNDGGMSTASLLVSVGVTVEKTVGEDDSKKTVGLEVGVTLAVLITVIVVAVFIIVLVLYSKRYRNLQGRYRTLQEGATPMALSGSEFQEDFGYSKDEEADDKALVDSNGEL